MEIRELRVGNKVKCKISNDAGIYTVLAIPAWGMDGMGNGTEPLVIIDRCPKQLVPESKLKPIPLSTELLVKCGFDGKKHPKRRWKKLLAESYLTIYFEDDKISIQDYDWFMEEMPHIKHLHQLQNLYYSLTGIELKCEL